MFRRKPTRIELKVEDLQEYEVMKKGIEQKNSGDQKIEATPVDADELEGAKLRISMINERLGYKPQPRVSN
ncbi:Anaphase-promoting complex subunit CDC26 like protein [Argiope bruennichi]|uniref:Anaphase-promoting complex subunit CDC26 n=1 Tax=Argiope bruennichi TaxID=94029 RepID=A0A8T0E5J7_ARGBR|nr:Anaphase-promoting complex subunit CDC26 like protein [Argiope bruennichi]